MQALRSMMQGGACKHAFFFLVPKLCLGTHLHNKLRLCAKQSFADKFIPKEDFGNEAIEKGFAIANKISKM